MAPFPAEIDLFTVPHSRMKELVHTYSHKVQCVDYRNRQETCLLLKELQHTLYELKSHEWIENMFIMDQLKNRLKQRHIYNSAVCNCHNDNRLAKMWNLVKRGKHLKKRNIMERIRFGEELQQCFSEFVEEFLPHMEEEENIFQPLMVEHFEYEELRVLKDAVLEQHELIKDPLYREKAENEIPEFSADIKEFRDLDSNFWSLTELFSEQREVTTEEIVIEKSYELPSEILMKIFSYLTPPDRGRCARVCSRWNDIMYSSPLWKEIYPVQWAKGIWVWEDVNLNFEYENQATRSNAENFAEEPSWKYDEDADVDEESTVFDSSEDFLKENRNLTRIITYLLPRIGDFVKKMVIDAGRGITSRQIREALMLCPNIQYLSAAYTAFDSFTLKGLQSGRGLRNLMHLDVQGCDSFDDACLSMIAECINPQQNNLQPCPLINRSKRFGNLSIQSRNKSLSKPLQSSLRSQNEFLPLCPFSNDMEYCDFEVEIEELCAPFHFQKKNQLIHLNLSGCSKVTERGLTFLLRLGVLQNLTYLNISSCFNMSGLALSRIVEYCTKLAPENLYYCNSIINGPFPLQANGCDNIDHPVKICCLTNLDA